MPCSCRRNKAATVIMPPSTNTYIPVRKQFVKLRSKSIQASDSISDANSQYDFSATTLPSEGCNNCALKHISFASVLVQRGRPVDTLAAAAQLWLASCHYSKFSGYMQRVCKHLALLMAYDIDVPSKWREQVDRLVQISNEHDAADFLTKYNIESDTQRALYSRFMLQVACAFSLLFTQVGYVQLNRNYAVGYLVAAASAPGEDMRIVQQSFTNAQKTAFELRKLWKMIQQMKQNDDLYHQCRKLMLHLMRSTVSQYIRRYVQSDSSSAGLSALPGLNYFYSIQQMQRAQLLARYITAQSDSLSSSDLQRVIEARAAQYLAQANIYFIPVKQRTQSSNPVSSAS